MKRSPWSKKIHPDLVLCDIKMPGKDGIETLDELKQIKASIEVIMLTAHSTVESAVAAMKLGAADYLKKPFDVDELKIVINKTLGVAELKRENTTLREEIGLKYGIDRIVGKHPKMLEIYELIKTVAPTKSTVLIHGESGTGKELIAGAIHYLSPRRHKRFVQVNCAAISEELLESELFGHEKGSFTGAIRSSEGKFIMADGGSVLLDEVSEMSPKLQAKLLRVLQEKEVDKVGGREPVPVDVRVMATTNRNLEEEIKKGTLPGGSLLPFECGYDLLPATARTEERYSIIGSALFREIQPGDEQTGGGIRYRGGTDPSPLSLAGQRASVRELHRTGDRFMQIQDNRENTIAS